MKDRDENERPKAALDSFLDEGMLLLVDFVDRLGIPDPPLVLANASAYLQPISRWLEDQQISPDDHVWIITRIGYFVGELFAQKYGGCWRLNESPGSRFFRRYVIGEFSSNTVTANVEIDPFSIAQSFIDSPSRQNLEKLVEDVEAELLA